MMKPLGRFFQVTETLDFKKYFLDIDKIEKYPITFVVKSTDDEPAIRNSIEAQARSKYGVDAVVNSYMSAIEEIINIAKILDCFNRVIAMNRLAEVMKEIEVQSKVEFNYEEIVADSDQ